jgi:hypothetical protein
MSNPVPELQKLLGSSVVFINWPKGVKGSNRKWGNLTVADMTQEYLANLPLGNIGVALGKVSGDLCVIDLDDDALVEPFLALNPHLRETLQTHGARGRSLWIRLRDDYPRTVKLKNQAGEFVGEFRSNGSQSIIWGIHPDTDQPYRFVVKKPVVELEFGSITWPPEIANPPSPLQWTEETEAHRSHSSVSSVSSGPSVPSVASVSSVSSVSSVHSDWLFEIKTLEDAVRVSMPERVHENNHCLFTLARAVKALEMQGEQFTPQQLRDVFERWFHAAKKFLRPGQTKEDYLTEFLCAYRRAKYPLGSVTVPKAWKLAQEKPLPPEAMQFENPQLRLLVALCRELQILNGKNPFYLSSRSCKKLFGHENHSTAAKWLGALCAMQIIREVEKGNAIRATRYRYLGPT